MPGIASAVLPLILTVWLGLSPASAAPPGDGHSILSPHSDFWKDIDEDSRTDPDADKILLSFSGRDRAFIHAYYEAHYDTCPSGLIRRNGMCQITGSFARHRPGETVSAGAGRPLPQKLLAQLQPVPAGTAYRLVDQTVMLLSVATGKILDLVPLASRRG